MPTISKQHAINGLQMERYALGTGLLIHKHARSIQMGFLTQPPASAGQASPQSKGLIWKYVARGLSRLETSSL